MSVEVALDELVSWASTYRGVATVGRPEIDLDIADPFGHDASAYERAYLEIDAALARVVDALLGQS